MYHWTRDELASQVRNGCGYRAESRGSVTAIPGPSVAVLAFASHPLRSSRPLAKKHLPYTRESTTLKGAMT